jgi:hypothetical protein
MAMSDGSAMLFPWERSAFGDRTVKLAWWQKARARLQHASLRAFLTRQRRLTG